MGSGSPSDPDHCRCVPLCPTGHVATDGQDLVNDRLGDRRSFAGLCGHQVSRCGRQGRHTCRRIWPGC
ncbi:MAG: hypothetical protein GY788_20185 [bacterium]|nr:hypothetical protein [bacterium]